MKLIQFIFSDLWIFIGFTILFCVPFRFLLISWNRYLRSRNIAKHGWPPPYCDADGDFKPKELEDQEEKDY